MVQFSSVVSVDVGGFAVVVATGDDSFSKKLEIALL